MKENRLCFLTIIIICVTTLFLFGAGKSDSSDLEKKNPYLRNIGYEARTLYGLEGICVAVLIHPEDIGKIGTIERHLKTDIEFKENDYSIHRPGR